MPALIIIKAAFTQVGLQKITEGWLDENTNNNAMLSKRNTVYLYHNTCLMF